MEYNVLTRRNKFAHQRHLQTIFGVSGGNTLNKIPIDSVKLKLLGNKIPKSDKKRSVQTNANANRLNYKRNFSPKERNEVKEDKKIEVAKINKNVVIDRISQFEVKNDKKKEKIRDYFKPLLKNLDDDHDEPSAKLDVDLTVIKVKKVENAFELLMKVSRGDTLNETPGKRTKRLKKKTILSSEKKRGSNSKL